MKFLLLTMMFITTSVFADVRVEIIRELPNERQTIVQNFDDIDLFQMWMGTKMEEGCDPYVTNVHINLNYDPQDGGNI
jgi:hypothetical protein